MQEGLKLILNMLPFLIPLFIIQVTLMVIAIVDLVKRERVRVRGRNKLVWALVIILINVIGPVIYLLAGRVESVVDSD